MQIILKIDQVDRDPFIIIALLIKDTKNCINGQVVDDCNLGNLLESDAVRIYV